MCSTQLAAQALLLYISAKASPGRLVSRILMLMEFYTPSFRSM